jgi:hypothetical protein
MADLEAQRLGANETQRKIIDGKIEELAKKAEKFNDLVYSAEDAEATIEEKKEELANLKNAETEDIEDVSTQGAFLKIVGFAGYNFEKKEFHLLASAFTIMDSPVFALRGTRNPAGLIGSVDLCIGCTDGFHLWAGSPGQPLGARLTFKEGKAGPLNGAIVEAQFYLLAGPSLPKEESMISRAYPRGIQRYLTSLKQDGALKFDPIETLKSAYQNAKGGFGMGIAFDASTPKSANFLCFELKAGIGLGFDLLLAKVNGYCIDGRSINGFHGTGTAIAYIDGELFFKKTIWGRELRLPLINATAGLVAETGFNKDMFYGNGNLNAKFSALGGAVTGRVGVDFKWGQECTMGSVSFENGVLNVIDKAFERDRGKRIAVECKYDLYKTFAMKIDGVDYADAGVIVRLIEARRDDGSGLPKYASFYSPRGHDKDFDLIRFDNYDDRYAPNSRYLVYGEANLATLKYYEGANGYNNLGGCHYKLIDADKYKQKFMITFSTNGDKHIIGDTLKYAAYQ